MRACLRAPERQRERHAGREEETSEREREKLDTISDTQKQLQQQRQRRQQTDRICFDMGTVDTAGIQYKRRLFTQLDDELELTKE